MSGMMVAGKNAVLLNGKGVAEHKVVMVYRQPFTYAVEVEKKSNSRKLALLLPVNQTIKKDQVANITFYTRNTRTIDETGEVNAHFAFEASAVPGITPDKTVTIRFGRHWEQHEIPVLVCRDYAPGESQMRFMLQFEAPTIVQIGGIEVTVGNNRGEAFVWVPPRYSYEGREYEASWRMEALARIEQLRKGPLDILVTNELGVPVAGVDVKVRMKRHAFGWGTAVSSLSLWLEDEDGERYREAIPKWFNVAVPDNDFKWLTYEEREGKGERIVRWLQEQGMRIRGHTLVWDKPVVLPPDIPELLNNPEQLHKRIEEHIRLLVNQLKGKVEDWDVLNEPTNNHYMMDKIGFKSIQRWFALARELDPGASLYLNENVRDFRKVLKIMNDTHTLFDGIGLQGHYGLQPESPVSFLEMLNMYEGYGKKLAITEYDLVTPDEELLADFTRDILIASFSHPMMEQFIMWGFWDGRHWRRCAPIFRKDWTLKPSGEMYRQLIYKDWWTELDDVTGIDGTIRLRGYLGDYEITVSKQGCKEQQVSAKITREGTRLTVRLER